MPRTSERYVAAVIERVRPAAGAMDAALAEIDRAFGFPEVTFKIRVRRFIRRGPTSPANRARYGARLEQLRHASTDVAIARVKGWYRREKQAFEIATALGGGSRLSLQILKELRLMIRFARARKMALQPVIADVLGDYAEAAE